MFLKQVVKKFGLSLYPESFPVWDSDKEAFVAMEQYILSVDNTLQKYRIARSQRYDLDGDGKPEEYILKDGHLTVKEGLDII
ncbi:MAG: hypothetical protein WBJ17_00915 [Natronincolaceae bacterium]